MEREVKCGKKMESYDNKQKFVKLQVQCYTSIYRKMFFVITQYKKSYSQKTTVMIDFPITNHMQYFLL